MTTSHQAAESAYPRKSVGAYIEGLQILAPYMEKGLNTTYFQGAEHDIIHLYVGVSGTGANVCTEDSADGQRLTALGFHVDEDAWAYFT